MDLISGMFLNQILVWHWVGLAWPCRNVLAWLEPAFYLNRTRPVLHVLYLYWINHDLSGPALDLL